ncbi:MAG: FimV/HubP family polar landmark protein, partial [Betaproteobacteria bacterium]
MRKSALAASIAVILGLMGSNAAALSLGRITVQSALGQPLRAEIEIPEINAEETDTLKASVASPDAFKAAGLEFNSAVNNLKVTLERRADGRMVLKLSSERTVNDPFIDLILEANWASGRVLRDYTLLFDPPSLREAAVPTPAQVSAAPVAAAPAKAAVPERQAASAAAREAPPERAPKAQRQPPEKAAASAAKEAPAPGKEQIAVRPGDTASKIASAHKETSVSLDQMLVALLRANPEAFAGNNVNRLKSGALLDLPSADQAMATPRNEASSTVIAQSKDFEQFRRQLAAAAPAATSTAGERGASGKVRAQVDDKKTATPAPDKLTLSKATAQAKALEDKVASERQAKEAAARAAELTRNIAELDKLKAIAAASAPAKPSTASAPPVAPAGVAAPIAVASAAATPARVASAAPTLKASTPTAPKPAPKASVAKPVEEPDILDSLIENPWIPAGALGTVVLALLGWFGYRSRQRKSSRADESSFLDSHLQPDSFFGASGGERVDTST